MLQPAGTLTLIHYNTETYLLNLCSYYIPFVETGYAPSPIYMTVIKKQNMATFEIKSLSWAKVLQKEPSSHGR